MMRELAQESRQKRWFLQQWTPSPALSTKTIEGTSVTKYVGQKYNPKKTKLIEGGWDHDHCLFCWQSVCNCGGEDCVPQGYTDGNDWICPSCHEKVILKGEDPT